jgi:hypothetical protein
MRCLPRIVDCQTDTHQHFTTPIRFTFPESSFTLLRVQNTPACQIPPRTSRLCPMTASSSKSCAQQLASPAPSRRRWTPCVMQPEPIYTPCAYILTAGFRETTNNRVDLPTIKYAHLRPSSSLQGLQGSHDTVVSSSRRSASICTITRSMRRARTCQIWIYRLSCAWNC